MSQDTIPDPDLELEPDFDGFPEAEPDMTAPFEFAPQEQDGGNLQHLPQERPGEAVFELHPAAVDLSKANPLGMARSIVELLALLRREHGLLRAETLWPVGVDLIPAIPALVRKLLPRPIREFIDGMVPQFANASRPVGFDPRLLAQARLRIRVFFDPKQPVGDILKKIASNAGVRAAEPVPYRWLPLLNERSARIMRLLPPEPRGRGRAPAGLGPAVTPDLGPARPTVIGVVRPGQEGPFPDPTQAAGPKGYWGRVQTKCPEAWGELPLGNIAVLDSGCDALHPALAKSVYYLEGDEASKVDTSGHGTFVCGIIAGRQLAALAASVDDKYFDVESGLLPQSRVLAVNVMEEQRVGDTLLHSVDPGAYSLALRRIADKPEIRVVNLSLGSENFSQIEADDIALLEERGVTVVASCGNALLASGKNTAAMYPALLPTVVSVGALAAPKFKDWKPEQDWAPFSVWPGTRRRLPKRAKNMGRATAVDLYAPGQWILSSAPMAPRMNPEILFSAWLSGTSMAAPYVTAAAAVLASQGLAPAEIRDRLKAATVSGNLVCDSL